VELGQQEQVVEKVVAVLVEVLDPLRGCTLVFGWLDQAIRSRQQQRLFLLLQEWVLKLALVLCNQ
jgi:hypothetical protein